jgi:hypothetical protein
VTLPTAEESLGEALRILGGPAGRATTRKARQVLDDAHEALVRVMVHEAHATACVSMARRRLKDGDVKGARRDVKAAARHLGRSLPKRPATK